MTTTRDPANPVWTLLKILRADLRVTDLADACPSELAELQQLLAFWAGVVAVRRREIDHAAAAPHNANRPDALERPAPDTDACPR